MSEGGMVIVGGGKAGARAVVGFRENGWTGSITLVSDEELPPYDRPPLSKAAISDESEPQPTFLLDEDMITSLRHCPGNFFSHATHENARLGFDDGYLAASRGST